MSLTGKVAATATSPPGGTQQPQPPASQVVPSANGSGPASAPLSTTPPGAPAMSGAGLGGGGTGPGSMGEQQREGSAALPSASGEESGGDDMMQQRIVEYSPQKRYVKFKEVLGKGAYKMVYRAYDTKEGLLVAWNTISLAGLPKQEKIRIMHEVRLLEQLDHGNIISFFGSWVNREREEVVFITEILSSGSLKDFIKKVQVIRWKIIKRWCRQILRGLGYLHSHVPPIIHRDLKCDNIFINGSSGDLRIGDLGLSTYITGRTAPLSVLGTPEFMAPELYDEKYDEKVDVYAFGMCVLEMVTKETPYSECANAAQIYKKVISQVPPQVLFRVRNERARDFIRACLASDPTQRPTVEELQNSAFLKQAEEDDEEVIVDPPAGSLDGSGSSSGASRQAAVAGGGAQGLRGHGHGASSSSHLHPSGQQQGPSKASAAAAAAASHAPPQQRGGGGGGGSGSTFPAGMTRDGPGETLRRVSRDAKPVASQLPAGEADRRAGGGGGGVDAPAPPPSSGSSDGDPAELHGHMHHHHHHHHHGHYASHGGGGVERTLSSHSLATSATSEGSSHHPYELPTPALSHSGSEGTLESVNTSSPVLEGAYGEGVPAALDHGHHHQQQQHGLHGLHSQSASTLLRDREGKPLARAASFYQQPAGERPPRHAPSPMSHSGVTVMSQQHRAHHHHHHHLEQNDSWALLHVKGAPAVTPGSGQQPLKHQQQPSMTSGSAAAAQQGSAPSTPTAGPTVQLRSGGGGEQEGGGAGRSDVLCLVIRAKIQGKLRDIEFDFHLAEDDATQVGQEMVSELGLPASDLPSVASTIHRLAEESRRQRDRQLQQQHRGMPPPPPPHEVHRTTSLEGPAALARRAFTAGEGPPPQGGGVVAPNGGGGGRHRGGVPMPRSLSTNNMGQLARGHGGHHPGVMGEEAHAHAHAPMASGFQHARTHSGLLLPLQHGRQRSDASDDGGDRSHRPLLVYHHHHAHPHLSDDDLSRASPAASVAGDHYAGCLSSDDESGPVLLEREGSFGGDGADDEAMSKLRSDYEKNVQRSQKAFSIRLENLRKSKLEKEESHRKQLEKHVKELAEFERKVRTAEREQIARLRELEEQWRATKAQHRAERRRRRLLEQQRQGDGDGGGSVAASMELSSSSAGGEQRP